MAKMHPSAVDLVLAVKTCYVQDATLARTHACAPAGAARGVRRFFKN
jgi:hypothetical protein